MRPPIFIAILALATAAAGIGTSAAPQQSPATFRSRVTLVGVDVTVLDKDGRPVAGLTADDFQIRLNGTLRPVRTVSYDQVTQGSDADVALAAAVAPTGGHTMVTNTAPVNDPKIFVLAIDDLSLPADGGRRTLTAARRFVDSQPSSVLVGVTTTSGAVAVNPTRDRSVVSDALSRVVDTFIDPRRPQSMEAPSIGITEALEIAGYNNTSVRNSAIERECLDGGRALQTGEYGSASNAIGNYNSKCATDLMASARLITSLMQGTASQQISSLTNVISAMHGAPGLKHMIVLTHGVAGTRNLPSLFEPIATAASAAGVQLSFLMEDEDDLDMSTQDRGTTALNQGLGGSSQADRRREDRRMFMVALQTLADTSGGTFERVITNPDGAFQRAALAGSAVYRLGVEAPPDAQTSQPIDVRATVDREGVTLHVNRHTLLPGAVVSESSAERVSAAIRRGTPHFGVPVRMGVARRRAASAPDTVELVVDLEVPASVTGPLTVTIGVLDADGALKQGTRPLPHAAGGADYRMAMPLPVKSGPSHVRLAVEDAAGSVGSVDTEVDARLTAMGPITVSDLLTWWKDGAGHSRFLALAELPIGVAHLSAGIELYPRADTAMPEDLSVRLSISATGSAIGDNTPVAEVSLTPRIDGDILRADATLPIGSLAPGSYVIRATVFAGGQRLGVVTTIVSKSR